MKRIVLLLNSVLLLVFLSCSTDDSDGFVDALSGYYKIVSVTSDTPLDLNNDGFSSHDFYAEISGLHTTTNGDKFQFYDFESIQNYMEIRPTELQNNKAQLIDFKFPHQYIGYMSDNTPFLHEYLRSFINYSYKIVDNQVQLSNGYLDEVEGIGEVTSLHVLDENYLKATMIKNIFDFQTNQWVKVQLDVTYLKIID